MADDDPEDQTDVAPTPAPVAAPRSALSPQDRDYVIRTVLSEAKDQGAIGQAAVANVIKNRVNAGGYGSNPTAVVLRPKQFEPWNDPNGRNYPTKWKADSPDYAATGRIVDATWSGEHPDPTNGAVNFWSPGTQAAFGRKPPKWASTMPQTAQIGGHLFYGPGGSNPGKATQTASASDPWAAIGGPQSSGRQQLPDMVNAYAPGATPSVAGGGATPGSGPGTSPLAPPGGASPPGLGAPATPGLPGGLPGGSDQLLKAYQSLLNQGMPQSSPRVGLLNALLFGPKGFQGQIGQALPNGLLGGAMNGLQQGFQGLQNMGVPPGASPGGPPMSAAGLFPPVGGPAALNPQNTPMPPPPQGGLTAIPPQAGNPQNIPVPPPRPPGLGGPGPQSQNTVPQGLASLGGGGPGAGAGLPGVGSNAQSPDVMAALAKLFGQGGGGDGGMGGGLGGLLGGLFG